MLTTAPIEYEQFLKRKVASSTEQGFDVSPDEVNPVLLPHQRAIVQWAVQGGRRAVFAAFGLGKTMMQLETVRLTLEKAGAGRGLIVMPLGVRQEFKRDAEKLDIPVRFIRSINDASDQGIYLTNYETVREGKLDPQVFTAISLDEAGILRGFGGTKTFREFMATMAGDDRRDRSNPLRTEGVPYRFVATATPSPNDFIELLAYSAFLGIMEIDEAKTRFFKRDSTKADKLTLHPHKEREFWLWVSSWAIFLQRPSDLGYSDKGYDLPPLAVKWHEQPTDHTQAGAERNGQGRLMANAALGVVDASREKRNSIPVRVEKLMEIAAAAVKSDQVVIWCDLNDEQKAIEEALSAAGISYSSLYGSQSIDARERLLEQWRNKETQVFLSKPMMYGAGINLQQCHTMIFAGVGFKFNDVIQACHRIYRFLQEHPCSIHFIYTEAEREVRGTLERKWAQHNELVANMTAIIREYGLSQAAIAGALGRTMGTERNESSGQNWRLVNNDCVDETARMEENSVGLILTSIPFSYDKKTEILTRRGWSSFGSLTPEDEVATVRPDRLCFEWQKPTRVVWEHYEGEMLKFGNRSFDLLVTPNHRLFVAKRGQGFGPEKLRLVEAEKVAADYETAKRNSNKDGRLRRGWRTCLVPPTDGEGARPSRIDIPPLPSDIRTGHGVQLYWIESEDFMALAGWYLSEGHADSFTAGRSGGRISIAQVKDETYRREICDLFIRIGLPPSLHSRQVSVWCRNLAYFLKQEFGSGSKQKHIPAWVRDLHPDLLWILRDSMMKGDGARNGSCYISYSQELRDNFQEICLKTGWRATIQGTRVQVGSKQVYPEIRQAPERIAYSGMIGCATVPNGLLIVRRNGKPCVSGNSTQYEYTPSYNDFGHTDSVEHFFQQMDYLTPHLLRVLKPGRNMVIHVKDRIVTGGITGMGFQTVQPFHADCIYHYQRHGFAYLGMRTIVTDVVRENNQTYRLGWTEQCKDGSRMGAGMPEYLLIFRKPPTDASRGYADEPVVKDKAEYSRARWQQDANGFWRSSGNRFLAPEDLKGLPHHAIYKRWREHSLNNVHDHEHHVALGETLERNRWLPVTFCLMPPHSWHPDVWTDVARMRTLNGSQWSKGKELHICPLQLDVVERVINQMSMPGEVVYDPFVGIGTTAYCAVKLGRQGWGVELSPQYFRDAIYYCKAAEGEATVPTLFDLLEEGVL